MCISQHISSLSTGNSLLCYTKSSPLLLRPGTRMADNVITVALGQRIAEEVETAWNEIPTRRHDWQTTTRTCTVDCQPRKSLHTWSWQCTIKFKREGDQDDDYYDGDDRVYIGESWAIIDGIPRSTCLSFTRTISIWDSYTKAPSTNCIIVAQTAIGAMGKIPPQQLPLQ